MQRIQTKEESKKEPFEKWACDLNGEVLKKKTQRLSNISKKCPSFLVGEVQIKL